MIQLMMGQGRPCNTVVRAAALRMRGANGVCHVPSGGEGIHGIQGDAKLAIAGRDSDSFVHEERRNSAKEGLFLGGGGGGGGPTVRGPSEARAGP